MAFLSDFGGEAPPWASGKTYAVGQCVRDPMDWHFRYVRITTGAGTTNPVNDPSNWRPDGARPIKSIQRGVINGSNGIALGTATISAVITSKCELRYLGGSGMNSGSGVLVPRIELTNATTITAVFSGAVSGFGAQCGWELTEYY